MDMRVKMILDLIANTRGGARQAKADIKGVKDAAKGLDGVRGGQKISRDFLNLASSSKTAARDIKGAGDAARRLDGVRGPQRISRDFLNLSSSSKNAVRHLRETKTAADALGASAGPNKLARGLDGVASRAGRARKAVAGLHATDGRAGAGRPGARKAEMESSTSSGALLAGTKGLVGGYLGVQGARMAARATVGQSISFEKAMADVMKKVDIPDGQSPADLEKMIVGSAIRFGRSREEIAGLVAELGAAGVAYKDLQQSIELATKASVSWDILPRETGEKLAKIRTQHQMTLKELEEFGDKVNYLADTGASKERDVIEMMQRASAAAKAADVDKDTSLAFMTGMNSAGMQEEVVARGFAAMVNELRTAASAGGDRVEEGLKMLGLTPKQVEQGMRKNAQATLLDVMERFSKIEDKAAAGVKIFGKGWWDEFARMSQAAPEIVKNLKSLQDPNLWRGSMNKSLDIELRTTANHLERLKALASEVGDRLGRWALPSINEAIERIVSHLAELDRRAEERERQKAATKAEDDTASRMADGAPLTAEERERMANDALYRKRVEANASGKRVDKGNVGLDNNLRLAELDREREQLAASIETRRKAGATDEQLAFSINRLAAIADQIGAIDPSRAPRRPSAREAELSAERGQADRGEALALRERVLQLEARLATIDEIRRLSTNPADRLGYAADTVPIERRRNQADQALRNRIAPNATAAGRFGFGPGGAPASAQPKGAGPATTSFGLSIKDWAKSLVGAGEIDLGSAGITIAESLASGLRQGGASAESAASGIRSGITGAFDGADLSGAGAAMMGSLERGITAGGDRAVAAAQRVAARVKAATAAGGSGGGTGRISGALHDGVE